MGYPKLAELIMYEECIPSAQPDVPDTNVGDIISRQAAIEALYKKASRLTVAEEYCYEGHVAWSADVVYRDVMEGALLELPPAQPEVRTQMSSADCISRQAAIDIVVFECGEWTGLAKEISKQLSQLSSTQPDIIRCRDCKHWNQATAYHGAALSFGFCESDAMWRSLYGETTEIAHIDTDDDFFCGYAERREE